MRATNNLGTLYGSLGDHEAAFSKYQQAYELASKTGNLSMQIFFVGNMLFDQLDSGRVVEAEKGRAELELLIDSLPDQAWRKSDISVFDANLSFHKGDLARALTLADESLQAAIKTNDIQNITGSVVTKYRCLMMAKQFRLAEALTHEALDKWADTTPWARGVLQCMASVVASKQNDIEGARLYLREGQKHLKAFLSDSGLLINVLRAEAYCFAAEQRRELAWSKFDEIRKLFSKKKMRFAVAWAAYDSAETMLLSGNEEDVSRSRQLLEEARAEFEDMGSTGWVALVDEKLLEIENRR